MCCIFFPYKADLNKQKLLVNSTFKLLQCIYWAVTNNGHLEYCTKQSFCIWWTYLPSNLKFANNCQRYWAVTLAHDMSSSTNKHTYQVIPKLFYACQSYRADTSNRHLSALTLTMTQRPRVIYVTHCCQHGNIPAKYAPMHVRVIDRVQNIAICQLWPWSVPCSRHISQVTRQDTSEFLTGYSVTVIEQTRIMIIFICDLDLDLGTLDLTRDTSLSTYQHTI